MGNGNTGFGGIDTGAYGSVTATLAAATGGDDTANITVFIKTLTSGSGGLGQIPAQSYNCTGATLDVSSKRVTIEGVGQVSKITNTATSGTAANSTFYVTGSNTVGADWCEISNLFLEGNSTGGMGLYVYNVNEGDLTNLRVDGFTAPAGWGVGVNLAQYCFSWVIKNPVITNCAYAGLALQSASNANTVIGGWIYDMPSGSYGVRILSANGNNLIGTIIQGSGSGGGDGVELNGKNNRLIGCWIENNGTGVYINEADSVIDGCWFSSQANWDLDIYGTGAVIRNCHFDTTAKIRLNSGSTETVFENCTGLSGATITDNSGGKFVIRNCPGYNPVGSSVPGTAFALPASGTAWTNDTGVDGTLYVTAVGTVTDVVVNGVTVGSSLVVGQSIPVKAGSSLTLTYSAAPTLVFVGD